MSAYNQDGSALATDPALCRRLRSSNTMRRKFRPVFVLWACTPACSTNVPKCQQPSKDGLVNFLCELLETEYGSPHLLQANHCARHSHQNLDYKSRGRFCFCLPPTYPSPYPLICSTLNISILSPLSKVSGIQSLLTSLHHQISTGLLQQLIISKPCPTLQPHFLLAFLLLLEHANHMPS